MQQREEASLEAKGDGGSGMIVGISGFARTGKDTAANYLVKHHGFTRVSFADTLRDLAFRADPQIEVGEDLVPLSGVVSAHTWEGAKDFPQVRGFLQRLGVGAREILGENIWVDAAFREMQKAPTDRIVVPDVRFPNEANAIRWNPPQTGPITATKGTLIRLHRPGFGPINSHPSETALDNYHFDHDIDNDGTVDELGPKVARALGLA